VIPRSLGSYQPSYEEWLWLLEKVEQMGIGVERTMASLSEIKAGALEAASQTAKLRQEVGAQSAALTGLVGSVDSLIALVGELRNGLSTEEQALADDAMAAISQALSNVAQATTGELKQSSDIAALSTRAAEAGAPPAP